MLLHGGLSSGHNRWFDKSIQIIVANNGKAGLLGEHSMMDGMPMVSLANHITATTYEQAQERSSDDVTNVSTGMSRIFIGDAAAMGRRGSAVAEHIVKGATCLIFVVVIIGIVTVLALTPCVLFVF